MDNRDFNIDQNNSDYDFFHNRAALVYMAVYVVYIVVYLVVYIGVYFGVYVVFSSV